MARATRLSTVLALGWLVSAPARADSEEWNAAEIHWHAYDEGVSAARRAGKPVLMVLTTTWCPHCRNYSRVFSDERLVEKSKAFVMVHVDTDKQPDIGERYAPDGDYIPRVLFLSPKGQLYEEVSTHGPKHRYYYGERDPLLTLAAMDEALTTFRSKAKPGAKR